MQSLRYLIGSLTLAGAVVGAVWIVRMLRNADDRPGLPLQVEFRDARGLRAGADVRYRGVTVGTVRSVSVAADGSKAVTQLLLEPAGAAQACVNSTFWIVTPRLNGLTGGATGLDTLVRDAYVTFQTPAERGSALAAGSLLPGRERPPLSTEPETLDDVEHGDLLMSVLVPENHGLRPGSQVVFRGMQTGDVRSVVLAPDGSHVEVRLRIARGHRQTVTDQSQFWVARPYVSGALFSGFTVTDVSALLSPYVSYYGEPGKGVLVQDGYRVAAQANRPNVEVSAVPAEALRRDAPVAVLPTNDLVLVRITYAAVEQDTWSADDAIARQGSGLLLLDAAGRAIVVTARSLVDGSYTERDAFGGDPEIAGEQIQVLLPDGTVLRAGRVWVDGGGQDLAALVLEEAPPDLHGTPPQRLHFAGPLPAGGAEPSVCCAAADGVPMPATPLGSGVGMVEHVGGAVAAGDVVFGVLGRKKATGNEPTVVSLELLPNDLRPR
ncbi:MAG: MCE family protein [Planctomycetes bacterium]|nr:MCE family protein [Planctomycetota bacterium]